MDVIKTEDGPKTNDRSTYECTKSDAGSLLAETGDKIKKEDVREIINHDINENRRWEECSLLEKIKTEDITEEEELTEEYSKFDAYSVLPVTVDEISEDIMETNNHNIEKYTTSGTCPLLGTMKKVKIGYVTETDKQKEECVKLDTSALLVEYSPKHTLEKKRCRRSKGSKQESQKKRAARLAKMSAYAAQRIANETPAERGVRLAKMSAYAAQRIANETPAKRAVRLAKISAYAAQRIANESPAERAARLAKMSAYAAQRLAKVRLPNHVAQHKSSGCLANQCAQQRKKQQFTHLRSMTKYNNIGQRVPNETYEQTWEQLQNLSPYITRRRAQMIAAESIKLNSLNAQSE